MKNFISILCIIALAMMSISSVSADEQGIPGGQDGEYRSISEKVNFAVDEEIRTELKELADETKIKVKELKEKMKDAEDKQVILDEMKALHADRVEKVKTLLQNNPKALEALEAKKMKFEQHMEKRMEEKKQTDRFKSKRQDLVRNYKAKFVKRIGNRLDKIPAQKLEKVSDKIDDLMERYEGNDKISEERKEKFMAQLVALKEMIEEKLSEISIEDDMIDIDEILDDEDEDENREEDEDEEDEEDEDDEEDEEDEDDEEDEEDEDDDDEDEDDE